MMRPSSSSPQLQLQARLPGFEPMTAFDVLRAASMARLGLEKTLAAAKVASGCAFDNERDVVLAREARLIQRSLR